jgi:hypothetical protein
MTTTQIKIALNCYHEFGSMIDTCAHIPEEDNPNYGLFTALYEAPSNKRFVYADLNAEQIKMFIHFIQKQQEYIYDIVIPQLNDDRNYNEAGKCRYTIKALTKLMEQCEKAAA